jgi:hypothetical protein
MDLYALLALCSRAQMPPALHERLRQAAARIQSWDNLSDAAELHGVAPLVHAHLSDGNAMPPTARRTLGALALRHERAAAARARALADVLTLYARAGIDVLLLKGAALAQLVYARPGLRPMRDVDLLVREGDAVRAWRLLAQANFTLPSSPADGAPPGHHHLATASRVSDGLTVSVEIHRAVWLNEPRRARRRYDDLAAGAITFEIDGVTARAPAREEMLWHVYRHAFCMPLGYEPLRLVWVADLVSLVECWASALDWDLVKRRYPAVWRILPLLDALTPWTDAVRPHLPPLAAGAVRSTADEIVATWPRFILERPLARSLARIARLIVAPPVWWAQMRYGTDGTRAGAAQAWLRHQWTAWTQAARYLTAPAGG